ncbi:hypothetical protein RQP46_005679 [Phenoliferia psychrophenolica]
MQGIRLGSRTSLALEGEDEPVHFAVVDDDAQSVSSQTESLLGRNPSPRSSDDIEKAAAPARAAFQIPSRAQVDAIKSRRAPRIQHKRTIALGLLSLLITAWAVSQLLALGTRFGHGGPRINVILAISDGMGPASETLSRSFLQYLHDATLLNTTVWSTLDSGFTARGYGITPLDEMQVGMSRTRSSNSLVTDSAAGATAFASAIKTYNGAIGVEPTGRRPIGTVLEAAKRQGFSTGLVATSRITHATPAAFYAHVVDRDLESEIASMLVGDGPRGHIVDFAMGGGACFFLPNTTTGSCRTDDKDLIATAEGKGVTVLRGVPALRGWHEAKGHEAGGPVLGLFADGHMDFEIDRQQITALADEQPSLREMTKHALEHLENDDDKGFFLMVEGSRIDMASHLNDPAGHISDILAYHSTIAFLKTYVDDANARGTPTILISVSDHETGGISLGRQLTSAYPEYAWYPDAVANVTHSAEWLGAAVVANPTATREWLRTEVFGQGLGIEDVTEAEISRRAQIGWSTAGHSGVDVNLYAYGYNATGLAGNRENTEVGHHIVNAMGLDLDVVTLELNKNLDWFSSNAGHVNNPHRLAHVDHYHGEL